MTNWDKLTIKQLEQIERLVNDVLPPPTQAEEKPNEKPAPWRRSNFMNATVYKEIMTLREQGLSWDDIAKKYGYANGNSICCSCTSYRNRKHSDIEATN